MHEGMLAAQRSLGVLVRLTLATGAVIELNGDEVVSFSVAEGADSALLPGNVLSARLTLTVRNDEGQWRWGGSLRGERPLMIKRTSNTAPISQDDAMLAFNN